MSLSRQLIVLVPTTKYNETKHYIHLEHKKKQTKKPALPNKTNEALFRYIFTTSGQEMARALLVFL